MSSPDLCQNVPRQSSAKKHSDKQYQLNIYEVNILK